ncbi:class I SAM-dependent methyltransferase [Portibacter lacus]|uniref:Methyltransferase n=1 Tax=Portibacter lacus TaxID=1099794 RepID=A0AA37SP07_9BACT|nr:class I SAM-dependent methyltransferase [Portibacter lacus]GLR16464.1 methyltransferase [Portibacter lacus]
MSLRKLYYSFPPNLRLTIRKLVFGITDLFHQEKYDNGLPVPPRSLIYTGGGDFKETGNRFVSYFKAHGLEKEDRVLDIGSGIGRMALPLTMFLDGKYVGLDIMHQGVDWCNEHISDKYPNFRFIYLDLKNDLYRMTGENAATLKFPLPESNFNFSFLISVFTHMQPAEVEQYLKEIHRCLTPGGKCFATFFIYESEETLAKNHFEPFIVQDEDHALMDEKVKAANVAYHFSYLKKLFQEIGFELKHYSKGKWKDDKSEEDFQDFVVLEKI